MKRIAGLAALAALLVMPVGAFAVLVGKFAGPVDGGGSVHFRYVRHEGKRFVTGFGWSEVPVSCAEGQRTSEGEFGFRMRVRDGQFSGVGVRRPRNPIATVRVHGTISDRHHASGTIRIHGDLARMAHDCASGLEGWTAGTG